MAKETERRFLVRSDEWRRQAGPGVHYIQGYLSTDSNRNVRIRIADKEATLTIKGKAQGITRPEFEYQIPLKDAQDLERLCLRPILEKTRYKLRRNGLTWEIDEYEGQNKGLVVAEVETKSEAPIRKTPPWVGIEVSGDDRYRNISLVEHPIATWKRDKQKPDTKYGLQAGENLSEGLHRIFNEQLNAAVDELSNERESLDDAVHEARKCIKRVRSLLRLIRPVVQDTYDRENRRLQGVGRRLSEVRDAQALIETLQDLEKKSSNRKSKQRINGGFANAYRLLGKRKDKIVGALRASGDIPRVVEQLEQARKSIDQLSLKKLDFAVIVDSLQTTVKRGEGAFSKAHADPLAENFHECRKRVKDLRYQVSVLSELWPDVLEGYAESAKQLEQLLGDDHNLAVLATVLQEAGRNGRSRAALSAIERRQGKLRKKASLLSGRLYAEPTKAWTRRLESSWQAWA